MSSFLRLRLLRFSRLSSDEHWIVCIQKLYHGASAACLCERSSGLQYRQVLPSPFSDRAWDFFYRQISRSFERPDERMINTGNWLPKGFERGSGPGIFNQSALLTERIYTAHLCQYSDLTPSNATGRICGQNRLPTGELDRE